jgi:eukaryotic-like serine/threonine-protein kinase
LKRTQTLKLLVAVILAFTWIIMAATPTAANWPMVHKDPQHSGHISKGPVVPLGQSWSARESGSDSADTRWPVVFDDTVYVSSGRAVLALEKTTGRLKWEAKPPEGQSLVAPAVDTEGVYIPVPQGRILALDRHTGQDLWRFQAADDVDRSITVSEGRLYFASAEAKTFYCVDARLGTLIWESKLDLEPYTVPVVSGGLTIFSVQDLESPSAFLVALDSATGKEIWRVAQESITSSPAILGDKVIVGSYDFAVHAYESSSGKPVWETRVEDAFGEETAPAVAFGDAFLSDRVGNFYRLDGETGKLEWTFSDTEGTFDQSSPVIAGRTMFIGGGAGWLHAINVDTGEQVWRTQVGGWVYSGAADEERIYVGVKFNNQGVYAFEHDPDAASDDASGPAWINWTIGVAILGVGIAALILFLLKRKRSNSF